MQNFCENVRVFSKNGLHWNLRAAIDLSAGDVILEEDPLLIGPHWEQEQMICVNCHQESFVMCKKCKFFPLCLNCKEHNEFDCDFMLNALKGATTSNKSSGTSKSNHISKDFLVKNFGVYTILKLLLLIENQKTFCSCESFLPPVVDLKNEYRASILWSDQESQVILPLMTSGILPYFRNISQKRGAEIDAEFLHELCFLIDYHAFEVNPKHSDGSLKGVYSVGSRVAHSCVSNTVISFDDEFKMKIYAAVPISKGETIYNCYVNPLMSTSQRQLQLNLSRQLTCRCIRCMDPSELGTHFSSLKCQNCNTGLVLCKNPIEGTLWECNDCQTVVSINEVKSLLADVAEEMTHCYEDLENYESLLQKYSSRFHPNHFLMIDIKQNIASILGLLLSNPYNKTEKSILERKMSIIDEVLPVVRSFQPGISKLYTISLYESLLMSLELAEFRFRKDEISRNEYIQNLKSAKNQLEDVARMLSFEPKNSAEGQLAQQLIMEKKQIETSLNELATSSTNRN